MTPDTKELETRLAKTVERLKDEFRGVRSGRPMTQLVDHIEAEYAGTKLPLNQLGTLGVRPPREIMISVWDKNAVPAVVQAIEAGKLGVTVSSEGNTVRVFLPPLSDERRQELSKVVRRLAEDIKIEVRGNRDEANKRVKAAEAEKEITEDEAFKLKERTQKAVDAANKQIEEMVEKKLVELKE